MSEPRCCVTCGRWGERGYRPADNGAEGYVCTNDATCALRVQRSERAARSASENVLYSAQAKDWSGQWSDDGGIVAATAREAYDQCGEHLASLGYSGVQVRVLRHVTTTTVTVVPADEFIDREDQR